MDSPATNSIEDAAKVTRGQEIDGVTILPVAGSIALGLVVIAFVHVGSPGFLWCLACLAVGSLFGIIFAVPRAASQASQRESALHPAGLRANTNMEEISDWLTKILVGAGLVELKGLSAALGSAASFVASSLPVGDRSGGALKSIAASIIIYFTIEGFIGGYLITRVFFQIAFQRSDDAVHKGFR